LVAGPDGRLTPRRTGGLIVGRNVTLTLTSRSSSVSHQLHTLPVVIQCLQSVVPDQREQLLMWEGYRTSIPLPTDLFPSLLLSYTTVVHKVPSVHEDPRLSL
jgi:hypothetical protein